MKKIILIAAAAITLCSCAKNKYVIEGNIEGLSGTVYMFDGRNIVDSTIVEKGTFKFTGKVDTIGFRRITDARGKTPATFSASLVLEPGTITVADNAEDPSEKKVTGTISNDASNVHYTAMHALINEYRNESTTEERRAAIDEESQQLTLTTVNNNLNNYFGAFQAQRLQYDLPGQELLDIIAKFTPEMQQTEILIKFKEKVQQKIRTEVGQTYIDITLNNADGQPVSLKSVIENPANKYTLLDFWASWCGPCMGEVPILIKTYDEFHGKGFEIYGVSFDNSRDKWLGAVTANKMNWIQVSSLDGFENQASNDYAISGIPSNFLIDAQGTIVATNLRGEALYEKIASLLAQ